MEPYPISVHWLTGTLVLVEFSDTLRSAVDLAAVMHGPLFEELLETGEFSHLEVDWAAGTLLWPNGLDIAPEALYQAAVASARPLPLDGLAQLLDAEAWSAPFEPGEIEYRRELSRDKAARLLHDAGALPHPPFGSKGAAS